MDSYVSAVYLGVYAALGMGNSIGIFIVTLVSAYSAILASRYMHSEMLHAIMRSPMMFFDTTPLGRIVNRFSKDIYSIDETIPRSIRSFITTFLQVVSIIVVICYSTWMFTFAIIPLGILYYWIQRYYSKPRINTRHS
jgi:ABC-type multidrug transport system fused ATPase/permease subunit